MSNSEKPFGTADNPVGSYRPKTLEEIERDAVVIRTTEETSPPEKKEPQKAEPIARPENGLLAARKRAAASKAGESKKEKAKGRKKSKEEKSREKRTPLHSKTSDSGDEKTSGTAKSETGLKIRRFFYPAFCFFRRHKALTITLSVILVIVLSGALTVNHFLNKINYVSQDDYANLKKVYDDEKQIKYITLSTGEIIDVSNLSKNADGTYNLPDGRRFNKDRTIWNTDGSIVFYDGSYLLPDGTAVLTDGTTFYPNELLVFQDGSFYEKTKISVDSEGYVTFFNGIIAHLTNFICARDGTCTAKTSALSKLKYTVSGSWNAFDKDRGSAKQDDSGNEKDEDALIDEALSKASGLNDDEIAENYNNNQIWYNDDIKNILIMGIDEGSKRYPYGRSDSMIVLSVNTKTKAVKMISFSRAVYAAIAGYENTRLNHAHGYGGAPLAIDTIERNYKIRIDNYVETGFDTFKQIIDVLGGVSINLSEAEARALKSKIKKAGLTYNGSGSYNLNGNLALEYVRLRKIDTDRERTARQRKVLMSIANKVKSQNVFQLTTLANKILPLITTDMSKGEILSQLTTVGSYLNGNVEQYVVPHQSSALTLIDEYEVLIVDWKSEVKYVHKLFYDGVTPSYYSK